MPKAFIVITESTFRVLEYLHTYRFLTAPQFLRLGLAEHIDSVHYMLRGLIAGGHVDFVEFGVAPGIGRLPRVSYLTARGAECLAEAWRVDPKTINYPKGGRVFRHDYFHRRATIDFQIELRLFTGRSGAGVEFFHNYFDTTG